MTLAIRLDIHPHLNPYREIVTLQIATLRCGFKTIADDLRKRTFSKVLILILFYRQKNLLFCNDEQLNRLPNNSYGKFFNVKL